MLVSAALQLVASGYDTRMQAAAADSLFYRSAGSCRPCWCVEFRSIRATLRSELAL